VEGGLADDGLQLRLGGYVGGRENEVGCLGKAGGQAGLGELIAIAKKSWEVDERSDAVVDCTNAGRHGAGWRVRRGSGGGDKGERDTVDLGVLRVKLVLSIGCIAHTAQGTTDDLFAE
jgi:hypothetical protein